MLRQGVWLISRVKVNKRYNKTRKAHLIAVLLKIKKKRNGLETAVPFLLGLIAGLNKRPGKRRLMVKNLIGLGAERKAGHAETQGVNLKGTKR